MQSMAESNLSDILTQKAAELFSICDLEGKGFICKRDMQRLQNELPLSADQLEDVFESLDIQGNNFLTLQEFIAGFGTFLGLTNSSSTTEDDDCASSPASDKSTAKQLDLLLLKTGLIDILDETEGLKRLYERISLEQPELMITLEQVLTKVGSELKKSTSEFVSLEEALRTKTLAHDEEMQRMYDEMEHQIKTERERLLQEETAREKQARLEIEKEVEEKDRQLQDLLIRHQELEQKLQKLNQRDTETKQQNQKLIKEKYELEDLLLNSQRYLDESKEHISGLRERQRNDKRDRAMRALQISEGIALERESLVKQLSILREMNRRLRDEKDEVDLKQKGIVMSHCSTCEDDEEEEEFQLIQQRQQLPKQGSIMSNYFDDGLSTAPPKPRRQLTAQSRVPDSNESRQEPVGTESSHSAEKDVPERVFKIVFVGDSGVGKSSFIHRFSKNTFKNTFCATIGVDFQVKTLSLDGHLVTLQLWDTAGQERFRSITKQYFRKADGVILIYDLSSETSFKNIRNWMVSVKEGTEDSVVMILANKVDLVEEEDSRVISEKDGSQLSDEYGALFYEVSAKSGICVEESMEALARLLQDKEDRELEKVLQINSAEANKKKNCC